MARFTPFIHRSEREAMAGMFVRTTYTGEREKKKGVNRAILDRRAKLASDLSLTPRVRRALRGLENTTPVM